MLLAHRLPSTKTINLEQLYSEIVTTWKLVEPFPSRASIPPPIDSCIFLGKTPIKRPLSRDRFNRSSKISFTWQIRNEDLIPPNIVAFVLYGKRAIFSDLKMKVFDQGFVLTFHLWRYVYQIFTVTSHSLLDPESQTTRKKGNGLLQIVTVFKSIEIFVWKFKHRSDALR